MHPRDNTRFSQGINKTTEMSTNPKPSETTTGTITATTKGGTSTTWGSRTTCHANSGSASPTHSRTNDIRHCTPPVHPQTRRPPPYHRRWRTRRNRFSRRAHRPRWHLRTPLPHANRNVQNPRLVINLSEFTEAITSTRFSPPFRGPGGRFPTLSSTPVRLDCRVHA